MGSVDRQMSSKLHFGGRGQRPTLSGFADIETSRTATPQEGSEGSCRRWDTDVDEELDRSCLVTKNHVLISGYCGRPDPDPIRDPPGQMVAPADVHALP